MLKKLKSTLIVAASVIALALPAAAPVVVVNAASPDIQGSLCGGTDKLQLDSSGTCDGQTATNDFNNIITKVVNIFSIVVGIVAVIMIIVGGFKYITSGGESNNVSSAKNTILFALVGLIIVGLAQFIVHFVLGHVAGVGSSGS